MQTFEVKLHHDGHPLETFGFTQKITDCWHWPAVVHTYIVHDRWGLHPFLLCCLPLVLFTIIVTKRGPGGILHYLMMYICIDMCIYLPHHG